MSNGRVGLTRACGRQEPHGTSLGRSSRSFTVSQKTSQKKSFTCIHHYKISKNKVAVFKGKVQNRHASILDYVFSRAGYVGVGVGSCVCAVEQRASVPP